MLINRTQSVAIFDPYGDRSRHILAGLAILVTIAGIVTTGAFFAERTEATPSPVAYDDVVEHARFRLDE